MKNKKHFAFLGAIILFVIVLASGVYIQEDLRRNGQQVILSTIPVDPRDLLRGDYVDLSYEIARGEKAQAFLAAMNPAELDSIIEYSTVFTSLVLGDDNRVLDYSFTTREPESGVYIRGKVVDNGEQSTLSYPHLEQYFVPEGKGWVIDRMGRMDSGKKLEVKIVTNGSQSQILELLIDGEPVDFSQIEAENPWTDEPVRPEPEPVVPLVEKV